MKRDGNSKSETAPDGSGRFGTRLLTLGEVTASLGGRLEGDAQIGIRGVNGIREARPDELTFFSDTRWSEWMEKTAAAAVIVGEGYNPSGSKKIAGPVKSLIRVSNPEDAVERAVALFAPPAALPARGIHPTAVIAETALLGAGCIVGAHAVVESGAVIGDRCVIYAGVYIGHETVIGDDCLIYPNVTVRERVRIGRRVILHPNCVLGSDGFGYRAGAKGMEKIPHHGTVVIEDDVEIGAGTCIDRARFAETRIGAGTKLDNLVQVAHNVRIGRHTAISGLTGIAGSTTVGNGVVVGGHVGIADHIRIGDGSKLAAMSGVMHDLDGGMTYSDAPARPHRQSVKLMLLYHRLPELAEELAKLTQRLEALENPSAGSPAPTPAPAPAPSKS